MRNSDCELKLSCEMCTLSRSAGSAKVQMGHTVVIAGVHGPAEARVSQQNYRELVIDVRVMGVTSRPCEKERMSGIEKIVSNSVHNMLILTNYPRLAITLTLQIIQDFGATTACCLNAACLALIDSGLQMKYTIAALSISLTVPETEEEDFEAKLEGITPSAKEHPLTVQDENKCERSVTLALSNSSVTSDDAKAQVVTSHCAGSLTEEEFEFCAFFAHEIVGTIFDKYKQCLKAKLISV